VTQFTPFEGLNLDSSRLGSPQAFAPLALPLPATFEALLRYRVRSCLDPLPGQTSPFLPWALFLFKALPHGSLPRRSLDASRSSVHCTGAPSLG
jgi:hypothetical protein